MLYFNVYNYQNMPQCTRIELKLLVTLKVKLTLATRCLFLNKMAVMPEMTRCTSSDATTITKKTPM